MHRGHHGHGQRTHLITRLSYRSRLTLVSRRALGEQATGVQMRQVSRFRSKGLHTCRASGKLCFKAKACAGVLSLSQRAEDAPAWVLHPPSLQGCRESPVGQVFRRPQAPPSQGHKASSRLHPVPMAQRPSGAPVHPKPLSGLWSLPRELPIPTRSSPTPPAQHEPPFHSSPPISQGCSWQDCGHPRTSGTLGVTLARSYCG